MNAPWGTAAPPRCGSGTRVSASVADPASNPLPLMPRAAGSRAGAHRYHGADVARRSLTEADRIIDPASRQLCTLAAVSGRQASIAVEPASPGDPAPAGPGSLIRM